MPGPATSLTRKYTFHVGILATDGVMKVLLVQLIRVGTMGSSGSGNFSDYSGKPKTGSGSGSAGGSSGSDKCREAFTVNLEDVANHDFYVNHGSAPVDGTQLTLGVRGRVIAIVGTESVGSLPTRLNYLAGCLQDGVTYTGVVTATSNGINPQVQADFLAD